MGTKRDLKTSVMEHPDMNPCTYTHLKHDGKKAVSSTNVLGETVNLLVGN
jgi:hypothetical protein